MRLLVAVPAFASALAAEARAQPIPKSQLGTVSQVVAGSHIDVVYRRPVARERTLFGAVVAWGRTWTPSADTAARITLSDPVEVNGQRLPAGRYSIWMIPDSASAWTVIFNSVPEVFHLRYPEGRDVLRLRVTPTRGDHVETLMFAFPMVDGDSARLEMRWGTTVVPLMIRIERPE